MERKKNILLIEDEVIISMTEKMSLEKYGYNVYTQTTGEKAVEFIDSDPDMIDLILMDIDLGSGIDGTEAAQIILSKHKIPIIFLTSHLERDMVRKVRGITRYGYVIKNSGDFVLQSSIEMAFELFESQRLAAENQERYCQLFEKIQNAFALHEIVLDDNGRPIDYIFLVVNSAFEKMTGLKRENIIGKRVTEVLPGTENDPADWIGRYGKIALGGEAETFEMFSENLKRIFYISAYSPQKGTFATIFDDVTDLRNYEIELIKSEKTYRTILDSIPESVSLMDIDGTVISVNRTFLERRGLSLHDTVEKNMYELLNWEPGGWRYEHSLKVIHSGNPVFFEDERNGIVIDNRIYPITDQKGEVSRLLVIGTDITQRTMYERSISEMRDILNATQEIAGIGGWQWNVLTETMTWSDEVYHIHDFNKEDFEPGSAELIDASLKCYDMPDRNIVLNAFRRCLETGAPYDMEVSFTTAKGKHLWVRTAGRAVLEGGKIVKIIGHIMDVSDRRSISIQLKKSSSKFRATFDQSPVGLVMVGIDRRFIRCNPAFCEFLGYREEELIGKEISEVTFGEDLEIGIPDLAKILKGELEVSKVEKRYVRKNGQVVWGEVNISLVRDEDGNPMFFLPVIIDITKRKLVEEQVRQQLTEKDILLREVNHRIKNNISSIESLLNMQIKSISNEEASKILSDAAARVKSIRMIYDRMLKADDFRNSSVKFYLESLIESIICVFPEKNKISRDIRIDDFQIDVRQLYYIGIIVNELVTNIMKYAFTGRASGNISVILEKGSDECLMTVIDDGNGFHVDYADEKMSTFGLKLVDMISRQLDGEFTIKSGKEGTAAVMKFPC